jgi:hypothetical protein
MLSTTNALYVKAFTLIAFTQIFKKETNRNYDKLEYSIFFR